MADSPAGRQIPLQSRRVVLFAAWLDHDLSEGRAACPNQIDDELGRLDQMGQDENVTTGNAVTAGPMRICHSDENRRSRGPTDKVFKLPGTEQQPASTNLDCRFRGLRSLATRRDNLGD